MYKNKIRIIGGKWKNSKIKLLNHQLMKPTTEISRERLFNWLDNNNVIINYFNCLDCYTGSGALSFELISRYYSKVTCLEKDKDIFNQLIKNINRLNFFNIQAVHTNTLNWLLKKKNL